MKKAANLEIETICPLHGPILTDTIPEVLRLYNLWSTYQPEDEGVFIAYASIHGNTAQAALKMKEILEQRAVRELQLQTFQGMTLRNVLKMHSVTAHSYVWHQAMMQRICTYE